MSFISSFWWSCLTTGILLSAHSLAFTGSEYRLDAEYSGTNFFDGWDFYSDGDPTVGTVTYYTRSAARLTGLISTIEDGPAYMGANSYDKLPYDSTTGSVAGPGRPSVRISSNQAWTHGLFIGDFAHIPSSICGTWPAFWTLGPNWPYTGEIDILEGVNLNIGNVMSLHTNETCTITGGGDVMTGTLENTNCATYPGYNVGCGVSDSLATSYRDFNQAQGGVYAMQWTSEYIRIYQWSRDQIPSGVNNKTPDPSSWGLPVAQLGVGDCTIDQHFQNHKIIFDLTFCGAYAGLPTVWNSNDASSCAAYTGLDTCDNYVANHPEAFKDAYWSVNYVRVYQLVDPDATATATPYIASEQPTTATSVAQNVVATPNINTDSLCPQYNFSIITDGVYNYEVACDQDVPGQDISGTPYNGFSANSMADCIKACTYMNENNGTNSCAGVIHYAAANNKCYFKEYFNGPRRYRQGYNEVRLIYYGYPEIADNPNLTLADSTATTVFTETIPTSQTYRGTSSASITTSSVSTSSISKTTTIGVPAMGNNSTSTTATSSVGSGYSQTVTESYDASSVDTTYTAPSTTYQTSFTAVVSTAAEVTNGDFYITFNLADSTQRLTKRAIEYLAFDGNEKSTLVDSEADATIFHLTRNGELVTSGDSSQYVAIDTTLQPPRFTLQTTSADPVLGVNVDPDGSVSFVDVSSYCLTQNGTLAVVSSDSDAPSDCQTVRPELVSTLDSSTDSTSSTASTTAKTTQSQSSSTAIPTNGFIYSGCFGAPVSAASIFGSSEPYTSNAMSNELCTSYCNTLGSTILFAGTYNTTCFCASTIDLYATLIAYPDEACSIPCPGANREMCGGSVGFQGEGAVSSSPSTVVRRQSALLLISLYNSTDVGDGTGESDVPTTTTTSTGSQTSASSGSQTENTATSSTTPNITSTLTTSIGIPTSFPADQVSYNVTGTNTATVISTTYVDVCDVCPGGTTTFATTITVPHCGCTASYNHVLQTTISVPSPSVPMTTTTKQCSCGHEGGLSAITVTIPCTEAIAHLAAQVTVTVIPIPASTATPAEAAATPSSNVPSASTSPATQSSNPADQVAQYAANTATSPTTAQPQTDQQKIQQDSTSRLNALIESPVLSTNSSLIPIPIAGLSATSITNPTLTQSLVTPTDVVHPVAATAAATDLGGDSSTTPTNNNATISISSPGSGSGSDVSAMGTKPYTSTASATILITTSKSKFKLLGLIPLPDGLWRARRAQWYTASLSLGVLICVGGGIW